MANCSTEAQRRQPCGDASLNSYLTKGICVHYVLAEVYTSS